MIGNYRQTEKPYEASVCHTYGGLPVLVEVEYHPHKRQNVAQKLWVRQLQPTTPYKKDNTDHLLFIKNKK